MDKILIQGGAPLSGTVAISGAKNAALPLMAACLLTDQPLTLTHMPHLADIASMANLLSGLGVTFAMDGQHSHKVGHTGNILTLHSANITSTTAPYDIVRKMRASVLVLGPLLARAGEATVSLPGGCAIGARPIDLHLKALEQMGAVITLEEGYVHAKAPKGGLRGAEIHFPMVSVGATENLLMAASLANGTTRMTNAAKEPEITDLAICLNAMGAKITGLGTDILTIEGVSKLHTAEHRVVADRIEMGTYAIAAAITGGDVLLEEGTCALLGGFVESLRATGTVITEEAQGLRIKAPAQTIRPQDVETQPFPGFATDMQAQFMALMCLADGNCTIHETIFENRFMHVPELMRMGADITLHGNMAQVRGQKKLKGAPVMATDLRASSSLILAGLAAEGETQVSRIYHLDRGYERLDEKLRALGAKVQRVAE